MGETRIDPIFVHPFRVSHFDFVEPENRRECGSRTCSRVFRRKSRESKCKIFGQKKNRLRFMLPYMRDRICFLFPWNYVEPLEEYKSRNLYSIYGHLDSNKNSTSNPVECHWKTSHWRVLRNSCTLARPPSLMGRSTRSSELSLPASNAASCCLLFPLSSRRVNPNATIFELYIGIVGCETTNN